MSNNAPKGTPSQPLDIPRILRLLACGSMREEHGMLRWSSNYTFLVSITDEDLKMLGVYKPQRGERPLWDFPDGTLCYREVSAYIVSDALGWQVVPPTVLRDGLRGLGSLQLYIDHDPDTNYFSLDESYADQLRRFAAFDYVINNADRKGGHVLCDGKNRLWGIDHGIGFHIAPKLRTVIWDFAGQPVPSDLLDDMRRLSADLEDPCSPFRV